MGNTVNLLTLRPVYKLNYARLNLNEFLYSYSLLNLFLLLFIKKKLFLVKSNLFLVENKIFLTFFIFFRLLKISKIGKYKQIAYYDKDGVKILRNPSNVLNKKGILKKKTITFFKSLKVFKKNILVFTVVNLNFYIRKENDRLLNFFKLFKRDGKKMFPRRFNFFLEFLQISILFLKQKITADFMIKIIAEIFTMLEKKLHSKFLNFINQYLCHLLAEASNFKSTISLKGLKFVISGKLKGKPRCSKHLLKIGRVPIQTLKCNIDYGKAPVYTIYGVFGFKLWVFR